MNTIYLENCKWLCMEGVTALVSGRWLMQEAVFSRLYVAYNLPLLWPHLISYNFLPGSLCSNPKGPPCFSSSILRPLKLLCPRLNHRLLPSDSHSHTLLWLPQLLQVPAWTPLPNHFPCCVFLPTTDTLYIPPALCLLSVSASAPHDGNSTWPMLGLSCIFIFKWEPHHGW